MRTCNHCGTSKPLDQYHLCKGGRHREGVCKACRHAANVETLQYRQGRTPRRKCRGCGARLPLHRYPLAASRLGRSYWCHTCTREADAKRRESSEHQRYLASSRQIARTEEEQRAWVDEGARRLREQTDAVRPVTGEGK